MATLDYEVAKAGDTADLIAFRRRGTTTIVEALLALNPGLARLGTLIPAGTKVFLPPAPSKTKIVAAPRIWS